MLLLCECKRIYVKVNDLIAQPRTLGYSLQLLMPNFSCLHIHHTAEYFHNRNL
jgi:hypothetical protein